MGRFLKNQKAKGASLCSVDKLRFGIFLDSLFLCGAGCIARGSSPKMPMAFGCCQAQGMASELESTVEIGARTNSNPTEIKMIFFFFFIWGYDLVAEVALPSPGSVIPSEPKSFPLGGVSSPSKSPKTPSVATLLLSS